ncbi:MAG: sigma-70 family RNA polymerase sigma factor [Spirochaetota bacterium]|mgnify:FL=1
MGTPNTIPAMPVDDITLLNGIRRNNMRCYRIFQEKYFGYIRHLFGRWVNDSSDAEELSCDVLAKVIGAIERYDPSRGSLKLWIYVIAINTRNDYLRRLAAAEEASKTVSLDEPVTSGSDILRIDLLADNTTGGSDLPPASYADNPGLQAAQAVINALPIDHRYILQLYSDGYTSSAIAQAIEKPAGTVRSICSRLIAAIRAAYDTAKVDVSEEVSTDEAVDTKGGNELHTEKCMPIPGEHTVSFTRIYGVPSAEDSIAGIFLLRLLSMHGAVFRLPPLHRTLIV